MRPSQNPGAARDLHVPCSLARESFYRSSTVERCRMDGFSMVIQHGTMVIHGFWSRGHPRTEIQVTCTHRDLFRALRSPAHASDGHMYTPARPTVTCTHRCGHLHTQVTVTSHVHTCDRHPRSHVHTTTLDMGWGGVITFMFLCTHRHSNLIIFLAVQQTQALLFHDPLLVGLGGVGWGNNIHVSVHTQAQQPYHLSCCSADTGTTHPCVLLNYCLHLSSLFKLPPLCATKILSPFYFFI